MKRIGLGILVILLVIGFTGVATAMLLPVPEQAKNKRRADNSPVIEKIEIEADSLLKLLNSVETYYKEGIRFNGADFDFRISNIQF